MTKLFFALLLIAGSITAQAGNPENGTPYKVKTDESAIAWTGHKVTGQHNGTIAIKDGSLNINDGILSGGSFTIDMTTISALDQQGEGKTKLEGHLKSDDFSAWLLIQRLHLRSQKQRQKETASTISLRT